MIIGHDMMVQLFLKADFGHQILEWDETIIPMKEPVNFLFQPDITKHDMKQVVIQTAKPDSTIETTERVVKLLVCNYLNAKLDKVAVAAVKLY